MPHRFNGLQLSIFLLLLCFSAHATQSVGVTHLNYSANESSPADSAQFYFFRDTPGTSGALQLDLSWSGTAWTNDFTTAWPTNITIPAGWSGQTLYLTVYNDAIAEGTETIICTITAARNLTTPSETITVSQPSHTIYIYDNEIPTVFVEEIRPGQEGGQSGTFRVRRMAASTAAALTVNYTLGGTAGPGEYTVTVGTTTSVTIPAGSTYVDVQIWAIADGVAESPYEYVLVTLGSGTGYSVGQPATDMVLIYD